MSLRELTKRETVGAEHLWLATGSRSVTDSLWDSISAEGGATQLHRRV